jgi:hypothetical protein
MLAMAVVAEGPVSFYLANASNGAILGGTSNRISPVAGNLLLFPFLSFGWCQTGTVNEALVMNLSGAVSVAGAILYIEV